MVVNLVMMTYFNGMCESLNKIVQKAAAESPFSNGLCKRHNAVLEDMLLKTTYVKSISVDINLHWAINAKNSQSNTHGLKQCKKQEKHLYIVKAQKS